MRSSGIDTSENIERAFTQRKGVDILQKLGMLVPVLEEQIAPEHNAENRERILRLVAELRWLIRFRQQRQAEKARGK